MQTISLNVDQLLTISVDIIAEAGDQLIVLGDVVIGVVPRKRVKEAPRRSF